MSSSEKKKEVSLVQIRDTIEEIIEKYSSQEDETTQVSVDDIERYLLSCKDFQRQLRTHAKNEENKKDKK